VFSTTDTIVAVATPPGRGGIGVVRLSGPDAHTVAQALVTHAGPLQPRHATLTKVRLKPPFDEAQGVPEALEGPDTTDEANLPRVLLQPHTPDERDVPRNTLSPEANRATTTPMARMTPDTANPAAPATDLVPEVSGFSRTAVDAIDQTVATFFPSPHSYTGEDIVELSAHGSPVVLRAIVTAAIARGARLAEPGEFTLRAFLNGRIDLTQAEAVNDLIDAVTPLQARAAFDQLDGTLTRAIAGIDASLFDLIARLEASIDFPEEGYHFVDPGELARAIDELLQRASVLLGDARRGRLIREGLQIAIVGEPNAGKSSVFNALAGASRAIVSDVPGTTRDLVTEVVEIEGLRVTLVDTAGLRDSDDPVEVEGVARARQSIGVADLVLLVEDRSRARSRKAFADSKVLYVANKIDLQPAWSDDEAVPVCATTGAGMAELRRRILTALDVDPLCDQPAMTNVRHIALVDRARRALERARAAALAEDGSSSEEFVLADLTDARAALEEVSGRRAPEELLAHIFSRFCIGK
jgi:tRNA modification GTPase